MVGSIILAQLLPGRVLLPWIIALTNAKWIILGLPIVCCGAHICGAGELSAMARYLAVYGGVSVHMITTMHSTQKIIDEYENNKKDVVDHAFQYSYGYYDILWSIMFGMISYNGFICLGTFTTIAISTFL